MQDIRLFLKENSLNQLVDEIKNGNIVNAVILTKLVQKYTGESLNFLCSTCSIRGIADKGINLLKQKLNQNIMQQIKCNYRFAKDKLGNNRLVFFQGVHYSNVNLTDKIAEMILKSNSKNAILFDIMPKFEVPKIEVEKPFELPKIDKNNLSEIDKKELDKINELIEKKSKKYSSKKVK